MATYKGKDKRYFIESLFADKITKTGESVPEILWQVMDDENAMSGFPTDPYTAAKSIWKRSLYRYRIPV